MRFEVFEVKRAYGPNGWEEAREFIQAFGGLNGFVAAAQAAADLALVGKIAEIWGVQETLKGEERRLVGVSQTPLGERVPSAPSELYVIEWLGEVSNPSRGTCAFGR